MADSVSLAAPTASHGAIPPRTACAAAGVCWALLGAIFVAQPDALSPDISFPMAMHVEDIEAFWRARPSESVAHVALHVVALVTAAISLSAVSPLSRLAASAMSTWAGRLATLGLTVTAVSNARYLALEPTYTRLFFEATDALRPSVAVATASLALDPYGLLEFGALGCWVLVVSHGLVSRGLERPWLYALAGPAALGFLGMVVAAFGHESWMTLSAAIGVPTFCGWWGALARHHTAHEKRGARDG